MNKEEKNEPSIIFYCKDCQEIVDTDKVGGKYVYKCRKCGTKNVAFGTVKSIKNFFKIEDKPEEEAVDVKETEEKTVEEAA